MMKSFLFLFSFFLCQYIYSQDIIQIGSNEVYDFCISPDGSCLYMADGKNVSVWDIRKKVLLEKLSGPNNSVIAVSLSKDSAYLAASSLDSSICIWKVSSFALMQKIKLESIANSICFNFGNELLAGLRNGKIISLDRNTGKNMAENKICKAEITCIALFDNLSAAVSSSDGFIHTMNPETLQVYNQKRIHSNLIRQFVFDTNGKHIYSCGDDGKVINTYIRSNYLEESERVNSGFSKAWITSIDYLPGQTAFATIRGDIHISGYPLIYKYHVPEKIFKIHFMQNQKGYMVLAVATEYGIKIIWATRMKSKTNY